MGIYQKILSGKIVFPKLFDKDAKVLLQSPTLTLSLKKQLEKVVTVDFKK